jgi:hypothetical protein
MRCRRDARNLPRKRQSADANAGLRDWDSGNRERRDSGNGTPGTCALAADPA